MSKTTFEQRYNWWTLSGAIIRDEVWFEKITYRNVPYKIMHVGLASPVDSSATVRVVYRITNDGKKYFDCCTIHSQTKYVFRGPMHKLDEFGL